MSTTKLMWQADRLVRLQVEQGRAAVRRQADKQVDSPVERRVLGQIWMTVWEQVEEGVWSQVLDQLQGVTR